MTLSKGHFLYRGFINHRRFTPFKQSFTYPIFLAYVDLGDINNVIKKSFFWNVNKTAIVSFNRKDYHGDPNIDLEESEKIEIKPSMIQPIQEIKSIGKFKVKIFLHSEVDAEIIINVKSAETIQ